MCCPDFSGALSPGRWMPAAALHCHPLGPPPFSFASQEKLNLPLIPQLPMQPIRPVAAPCHFSPKTNTQFCPCALRCNAGSVDRAFISKCSPHSLPILPWGRTLFTCVVDEDVQGLFLLEGFYGRLDLVEAAHVQLHCLHIVCLERVVDHICCPASGALISLRGRTKFDNFKTVNHSGCPSKTL